MGTLIRYELKKILCNRAGMVACACAYLLLVGITVANILTAGIWDTQTGTYVTGMRAQEVIRHMEQGHAGVLDDARVAADMATDDEAQARWAADAERLGGMSGQQIIDEYGIEFWREVDRVRSDVYYLRLDSILTLDDKGARASSLQEGAETLTDHMLSGNYLGYFPYSDAEQGYWKAKAAQISWPLEYGYAGAWDTISSYLSFYGFVVLATCIALSGVFTGEYQDRTAAIVLPTLRGERRCRAKVAASFAFATVYYWLSVASTAGIVLAALGPEGARPAVPGARLPKPLPAHRGSGVRAGHPARVARLARLHRLHAAALVTHALDHARGRGAFGHRLPGRLRRADRPAHQGRPSHALERLRRLVRSHGQLRGGTAGARPAERGRVAVRHAPADVRAHCHPLVHAASGGVAAIAATMQGVAS